MILVFSNSKITNKDNSIKINSTINNNKDINYQIYNNNQFIKIKICIKIKIRWDNKIIMVSQ